MSMTLIATDSPKDKWWCALRNQLSGEKGAKQSTRLYLDPTPDMLPQWSPATARLTHSSGGCGIEPPVTLSPRIQDPALYYSLTGIIALDGIRTHTALALRIGTVPIEIQECLPVRQGVVGARCSWSQQTTSIRRLYPRLGNQCLLERITRTSRNSSACQQSVICNALLWCRRTWWCACVRPSRDSNPKQYNRIYCDTNRGLDWMLVVRGFQ